MTMLFIDKILFVIVVFIFESSSSQIIQTLNELTIEEELPIGSIVTSLTDKIANLDQSIEYDLVKPLSTEFDLFSINHSQHSLIVRNRIDYEKLCSKTTENQRCSISVSIAVANVDTIDVYMLPIRILNIDDNHLRFPVNRTIIEIEENDSHWFEKSYALPRAIDDDGDPIHYSLYLQNWQKPTNLFEFDEIHLRLKPLKSFDREEENVYLLRLVAHNHHDLSLDVIVLIKDENDHSPRCEQNSSLFIIDNVLSTKTFVLNATDLDEGENGRLQFVLTTSIDGFSIDRSTGQIRFEPKFWRKSNGNFLTVNISDHGQSKRLSTECFIEIRFENFYQIDFHSDRFFSNRTEIDFVVENLRESIGSFRIFDRIEMNFCFDCQMKIRSTFDELFIVNSSTFELFFNETSNVFQRILTNHFVSKENLSVDFIVEIIHRDFPSFVAEKFFHFRLHFDKENLLKKFRRFYLRLNENLSLYHRISLSKLDEICSNRNETNANLLIDPTDTFVLDRNFQLVLKKILRVEEKNFYHLKIENRCSIDLFIYVVDRFSSSNVFPHLNESFRIISSRNLNEFALEKLPFGVKYFSSVPELIDVDSTNGSIRIRSPTIRTFSYYDFQIRIDDSRTPSFSSSLFIRIFFIVNENPPLIFQNNSRQTIEIDSSKFLCQINAFDADLLLTDQTNIFPPSIEFELEQNENLYVERFSGRIFLRRTTNERSINFTLIVKDFGFPQRLVNRYSFRFDLKTNEQISIPLVLLGTSIVVILTILIGVIFILIVCCCCCCSCRIDEKSKRNLSPHTADTRLIDHEYFATSLPRLSSREQRLFISHSIEKFPIQQQSLSMTDINKYLERFEKIYNDSSSQQYLHQPIGSVV